MKKFLSLVLVVVMLLSTFAGFQLTSHALSSSGSCGENVTYNFNRVSGIGILTISGSGDMADYAFEESPFYDNSDINIVYILDGVTSVGTYAFHKCPNLETVVFSNSIAKIGDCSFFNCKGLKNFTVSAGITSIGNDAFTYCSSLESISVDEANTVFDSRNDCNAIIRTADNTLVLGSNNTVIPDSVTAIGDSAFSNYPITSIELHDNIQTIGKNAFRYCVDLKSVTLPKNLKVIKEAAFINCAKLNNITIPDGVTSIETMAFDNCTSLKSIEIPDSVTSLGGYAFYECSALESVKLSNNLTSIQSCTFDYCSNLKSIIIPDSVTSIGDYAFKGCSSLQELTMPCSAKIYNSANTFNGCSNIKKITLTKGTGTMQDYSPKTILGDPGDNTYISYTPWYKSRENLNEIVIEDGVTNIGKFAFYECCNVDSISLPDSVTAIGNRAFSYCTGITSLTLSKHLTSIGEYAFDRCTKLKSVALPNTVTSIGQFAFSESGIESFKIPSGMNKIPYCLFANCANLRSVFVPSSVTSIDDGAFYNCTVSDIYYADTKEQWDLIEKGSNNFMRTTIHYEHPTHSFELSEVVEATCTHSGYTLYKCECGYTYIADVTPMTAHSYADTIIEPTTEAQGYTVHTCTICGYSYVDSITDVLPSSMNYIIPSLEQINATLTIKSDENEYTVTSSNGVFEIQNIKADTYRVYAKQKNSLTVCIDEFSIEGGDVVNDNIVIIPIGDVNGDDVIDVADLSLLLAAENYGKASNTLDLTGDTYITVDDISTVLQDVNYGKTSVQVV